MCFAWTRRRRHLGGGAALIHAACGGGINCGLESNRSGSVRYLAPGAEPTPGRTGRGHARCPGVSRFGIYRPPESRRNPATRGRGPHRPESALNRQSWLDRRSVCGRSCAPWGAQCSAVGVINLLRVPGPLGPRALLQGLQWRPPCAASHSQRSRRPLPSRTRSPRRIGPSCRLPPSRRP